MLTCPAFPFSSRATLNVLCRTSALKENRDTLTKRRGRGHDSRVAVGVRYAFEMQDNFIGQFCTMMFPHVDACTFKPPPDSQLICFTEYYLRAVQYLRHLAWTTGTPPSCAAAHRAQVARELPRRPGESEDAYQGRVQEALPHRVRLREALPHRGRGAQLFRHGGGGGSEHPRSPRPRKIIPRAAERHMPTLEIHRDQPFAILD